MRAVAIAVCLAVSAQAAHADDDALAEAIRLEAALDYEPALNIIEREITRGVADRGQLVTLHMFAGRLAAGLDRPAVAEDHFARVLALAPESKFSAGISPKITEPFDRARKRTAPLKITAKLEPGAITIVPETDPLGLAAGIAIKLAGTERELRDLQKRRLAIPAGARAIEVSALDAFGNRVWSQAVDMPVSSGPVDQKLTIERPLYARWPFWLSATVIAAGAGGACAWRFEVAQDEWYELKRSGTANFSTLEDVKARGQRWALAANISFGVTGVSALLALYTAARGSTTTVVVIPQGDGASVGVAGSF